MRVSPGTFLALGLTLALLAMAPEAFAQCALCKTVLTNSREGQLIARQFNHAILILLFAPYLVFGSLTVVAFRGRIREVLARTLRSFRR